MQTIDFTEQTAFPVVADPSGFWGWVQCAGAIGTAVATNALLAFKIAKIGGIARAIKLLKGPKTWNQRWQVIKQILGEVTGLTGIMIKCVL